MIGIVSSSLPGHEHMSPLELLDAAAARGLEGVLFANMAVLATQFDDVSLKAIADAADEKNLRLAAGMGVFNPMKPERNPALAALGGGDVVKGFERVLAAAEAVGAETLFFVVGMIEDRYDPAMPWQQQLERLDTALRSLAPLIRDSGVKVLIKTHEEITTFEILALIRSVGADVLGVCHDPVNVVCRLEDPVEATRRIAPYLAQVQVDDAYVTFEGEQMRRYLCPMGQGDLDWPGIFALAPDAPRWIEFHRGQFAMPVLDQAFVSAHPDLTVEEYRGLIVAAYRHLASGTAAPDQVDVFARLDPIEAWLRSYASR